MTLVICTTSREIERYDIAHDRSSGRERGSLRVPLTQACANLSHGFEDLQMSRFQHPAGTERLMNIKEMP